MGAPSARPSPPASGPDHSAVATITLALETSCDESSVALLDGPGRLLAHVTTSQAALHSPHGGVVPELASRNHTVMLPEAMDRAFAEAGIAPSDVDVFAATAGPGLASSLLVGNTTAKVMAMATGRPFIAVNHLLGHLLSPFFGSDTLPDAVVLIVSGGHTQLVHLPGRLAPRVLGSTRDDAAGEAFDKVGKLLGLPYPAGPQVDRIAREGNPQAFAFPRGLRRAGSLDFSFSGLKTPVRVLLAGLAPGTRTARLPDLGASFPEAVVDILVEKSLDAVRRCRTNLLAVAGGVAANSRLRAALAMACAKAGHSFLPVAPDLATDNAAMIAFAAHHLHQSGHHTPLEADIDPNLPLEALG